MGKLTDEQKKRALDAEVRARAAQEKDETPTRSLRMTDLATFLPATW